MRGARAGGTGRRPRPSLLQALRPERHLGAQGLTLKFLNVNAPALRWRSPPAVSTSWPASNPIVHDKDQKLCGQRDV
eukprot:scaffold41602_cov55-Phaeocystis_antarctica.AAC.5